MQEIIEKPLLFWHVFVLSFLLCTGISAAIQCWFLIHFCDLKSKKSYYVIYLSICYIQYLFAVFGDVPTSPMLDTLIGAGILFVFLSRLLKQNHILSAITAALAMAVTALGESILFLAEHFIFQYTEISQNINFAAGGLLTTVISIVIYKFFIDHYSIKSQYKSKYLLTFSLPIFFITIVLRTVNYIRYTVTFEGVVLQSDKIQNHEVVILTVIAFLCICTVLIAYEKTIKQVESDNERILLRTQISAQETYVAEAKQKYETTKAFRHDFKNHVIALRGLISHGDMEKAAAYMDRFEQIYQDITFPVNTENSVVDILMSEKLSYAGQMGIHVQCDIIIPPAVKIDDFDLCTIFANAIDNAIKASSCIQNGEKTIDIIAKPNKNFFVIDMVNNYQAGSVPKGSGLGLSAIQIIAEKYHGAVEITDADNLFRISVILPFDDD